jgi:hypothetical protein
LLVQPNSETNHSTFLVDKFEVSEMITLTHAQNLAILFMLIFASVGACAGLGVGTKLGRPASTKFLTCSYGFEVAASLLFLALVTSEIWLQIGFFLGGGVGIYEAAKGKQNNASQLFGWFVFLNSIVLVILVVVSLQILLK